MFKKTNPNPQMDMFSSPVMLLNVRASKKYSDPKEWHNQFYRFYTSNLNFHFFCNGYSCLRIFSWSSPLLAGLL